MGQPVQARDGVYPTTCWECSTNCGALATVRDGQVVKYGPNPGAPHSNGAFCIKGIRGAPGLVNSEDRLLYPQRRTGARGGGKWARISWNEALDEIADRLADVRRQYGPQAIVGATSGAFFSRSVMTALMLRSIGSPNWMINQDLCGGCRGVSAKITGLDITRGEDIANTQCALVVGRNSTMADPIEWMALKAAKKRGAHIVVIDPKKTAVAQIADLWLAPRVGTDAALALSMINVLITERRYDAAFVRDHCHGFAELGERAARFPADVAEQQTGVPADQIIAAARMYADGPSVFVSGHGIDASSVGVQTFRAFHALAAISGNIDRVGGNLRQHPPPGLRTNLEILHRPEFRLAPEIEQQTLGAARFPLWAGPRGWQTACHNPSVINAVLTDQPHPVRAMYISGVNIVVTYPDTRRTIEAMKALDFVVVAGHQMTPTAEFADILLPKTTTLEEEEVSFSPATRTVLFTRAVVPPRAEARDELGIAAPLLDRLEARQATARRVLPWRTQRDFNTYLLGESGIDISELEATGFHQLTDDVARNSRAFATPSGKVELFSATLDELGLDPLPAHSEPAHDAIPLALNARYPLTLVTGDRERSYHHSRFRGEDWAAKVSPDPRLMIHPDTAHDHSLVDGDWVHLEVAGMDGACSLRIKLSDATSRNVVSTGMGWWRPAADGPDHGALEINVNAVLSYDGPFDPVSGSSNVRGMRCSVEAAVNG
ncbi:MAG: molybdopterin-containing oxidoreductase family protein [Hyphomicrobiaceae bacterium]